MAKQHYTYKVSVSFQMQFTFSETEVEQSDEGDEGDMSPTEAALESLGKEIAECLAEEFSVGTIEVWADFDDLLGALEE